MKVTPMAGPASSPGTAIGSVEVGRTASPDKMERAKAIAAGNPPPEVSAADPQLERIDARRIKMRVNRTPLSHVPEAPVETPEQNTIDAESSKVDNNSQATVEATQPLSPQYAALAREKQAVRQERAELARLKAELEAAKGNPASNLEAELKTNPLGTLQRYGISYEQLTEALLADPQNQELKALKDEINALKEGFNKTLADRDTAQEAQVLAEIRREADRLVTSSEDFELVKAQGRVKDAVKLIHENWKQTGEVLDTAEALALVEEELLSDAMKIAALKKVQGKLAPPPQPQPAGEKQMRTLTARDTASRPLSAKERAIAAFHGTLKR